MRGTRGGSILLAARFLRSGEGGDPNEPAGSRSEVGATHRAGTWQSPAAAMGLKVRGLIVVSDGPIIRGWTSVVKVGFK